MASRAVGSRPAALDVAKLRSGDGTSPLGSHRDPRGRHDIARLRSVRHLAWAWLLWRLPNHRDPRRRPHATPDRSASPRDRSAKCSPSDRRPLEVRRARQSRHHGNLAADFHSRRTRRPVDFFGYRHRWSPAPQRPAPLCRRQPLDAASLLPRRGWSRHPGTSSSCAAFRCTLHDDSASARPRDHLGLFQRSRTERGRFVPLLNASREPVAPPLHARHWLGDPRY